MKRKREKHCPKIKATMSTAFTCHDWPIPLWDSRQEGLRQSSLSLNFNVHRHLKTTSTSLQRLPPRYLTYAHQTKLK